MAIAHFRSKFIGKGVSPVAAAAYRHRTSMRDHGFGQTLSYRSDADLVHSELALPADAPEWAVSLVNGRSPALASADVWNAVVDAETRYDAQYAREIVIALPLELTRDQNIALAREYVATQLTVRGFVADWVFHDKPGNPHIHIMHTLRPLAARGFGPKRTALLDDAGMVRRDGSGKIQYRAFAGARAELAEMRGAWGDVANKHLAMAGMDAAVDMRSFASRGSDLMPTTHHGAPVAALKRNGRYSFVADGLDGEMAERVRQIEASPAVLLDIITGEQSTFTERDLAKVLHRYVDDPETFARVLARVIASFEIVTLRPEIRDPETGAKVAAAVYSTRAMVELEHAMAATAVRLAGEGGFVVGQKIVENAIRSVEDKDPARPFVFAEEQRLAVEHVTSGERMSAIAGLAGAGKSTLLEAANIAWTETGHRVLGAALAGKAAEGLQMSSGIPSRTIAAWEFAWSKGRDLLRPGDVFVLDEAGMVSSKATASLVEKVDRAGAKLVLIGDPEQLQPIQAGAAFRATVERIGFAELSEIRRQREPWQQAATRDFARGNVADGLKAYQRHNAVQTLETKDQAIELLVHEWAKARFEERAGGASPSLIALAHTNADVFRINAEIRAVITERGALSEPIAFATARGKREFSVGDRMLFLENKTLPGVRVPDRVPVKNGTLGTVSATDGGHLTVALDTGTSVRFASTDTNALDHGYATTLHKSQGATVDQAFVLASPGMDRHMAYVAFSRHRDRLTVYAPQEGFREPLAATLSRSGAKSTTLDHQAQAFVARRGFETAADWVAAFAHGIADARERLTALWARAETAFARKTPAIDLNSAPPNSATPSLRDRLIDAVRSTFVTTLAREIRSAERHSETAARRHQEQDTTMNDMTPLADNPRTSHSKLTVDGNTACVEYPYDKDANTTFKAATSKLKPDFNKASGAYEIALSTDADERKFQLATIETARMQINGRLKELTISQGFAKEIAVGYQSTGNVEISARNGALAVKIPPAREAIDTLKQVGGTWVPKQGENGNNWRVEISNETDRNRVQQALSAVEGQVAAWGKSSELAKGIPSPHEEISLSTSGAKLFVSTPHMTETNRLLKSEAGGAEMKWDGRASAYAVTVTAENVDAIKDRLGAVATFYETQCLIPPHKGMPGIAKPSEEEAAVLGTKATGQTYASDKAVEAVVDKFADRIGKALSEEDRRELASMNPNQPGYDAAKPIASERLAALPKPALEELASLAATVRTARSEGVQQQLAQARDQAPAQGQGPTR